MKKRIAAIALVVALIAIAAVGSAAFFTVEDKAHNVITTGNIDIDLREWADDEKTIPFKDVDGVMPGSSVKKIVDVKNTGDNDAWVRIKAEKNIKLKDGGEPDLDLLEIDFNTADWTLSDGYWHYNKPLAPGETTTPLFTTVTFNKAMGSGYADCVAKISVTAYGVQSDNNGTAVLEAEGWPA